MEKRYLDSNKINFRALEENEKKIIEGYFILYDTETELFPDFYERIAVGAAQESIENTNNIYALYNHDANLVLASTRSKTLELKSDSKGVFAKFEINENDTEAVNIYHRLKRGDIIGASFGFSYQTENEKVEYDNKKTRVLLEKVELFEVSICPFPAYPQTNIQARSANMLKNKAMLSKNKFVDRLKKMEVK